jgi:hypothetical protein
MYLEQLEWLPEERTKRARGNLDVPLGTRLHCGWIGLATYSAQRLTVVGVGPHVSPQLLGRE